MQPSKPRVDCRLSDGSLIDQAHENALTRLEILALLQPLQPVVHDEAPRSDRVGVQLFNVGLGEPRGS